MNPKNLYLIALSQKWIISLIGGVFLLAMFLPALVPQGANLSRLTPIFTAIGWLLWAVLAYWVITLARNLANPLTWVFAVIFLLLSLPLIPSKFMLTSLVIYVICLLSLIQRASAVLRANNIKVGLLGANLKTMAKN